MTRYVISDAITGAIRRVTVCADANASVQALAGEVATPSESADPALHYIQNGAPIAYPAKPSPFSTWDGARWVDPRPLAQAKADRWAAMKTLRATDLTAPLATPWGVVDATDEAQFNIVKRILMLNNLPLAQLPATLKFTLADNTDATVTPAQMVQIGLLLGQQAEAAFTRGRAVRAAINAAATAVEVEAIKWVS